MRLVGMVGADAEYYLIAPKGKQMKEIIEAVCENTGMRKNSFADLQVKIIISDLFHCAEDLKYNYNKYYIEEYDTFEEFLYKKETMEESFIMSINLQENDTLWRLRYEINSYSIRDIIGYENQNLSVLNRFLEGISI